MRCLVPFCPVDVTGQMVMCAPHWSYLSELLRIEMVDVYNELDAQRRVGNPRRATRDAWRALRDRAAAELVAAHAALEAAAGHRVGANGVIWRRTSREIAARAQADERE